MYTYIDNHLQQRKSSLSSLTRGKKEPSKGFQSIKNQENVLSKQQSQQYIKSQQKSIMKSHNNDNINAIRLQQQGSSIKKSTPQRLRQQQSSDYIRNLYKKYLGKQNKQPVDKLNAFTERKLKTTESKQVIATTTTNNNTTVKEFARRTLFTVENDGDGGSGNNGRKEGSGNGNGGKGPQVGLMKKEKTKISHIVSIQSQSSQTPYQQHKPPHNITDNPKSSFQSNKKDSTIISKKQDKQGYQKQCESKKSSNKNFKSKTRIQKQQQQPQQQSAKSSVVLKRSQSTHVRLQKIDGSNNRRSAKGTGVEVSLSKDKSRVKEVRCEQSSGFVHPHRQSYCQFDTEQEIQNNSNSNQSQALNELNLITKSYQPLLNQRRRSTTASTQGRSVQNLNLNHQTHKQQQQQTIQPSRGDIFLRYINDLSSLQLIAGRQGSLFQTLQRINSIKNKKSGIKQSSKLFEQKEINFEQQRLTINHRLIL